MGEVSIKIVADYSNVLAANDKLNKTLSETRNEVKANEKQTKDSLTSIAAGAQTATTNIVAATAKLSEGLSAGSKKFEIKPTIDDTNVKLSLQEMYNEWVKIDGAASGIDLTKASNQLVVFETLMKTTEEAVSQLTAELGATDERVIKAVAYATELKAEFEQIKQVKLPEIDKPAVALRTQLRNAKQELDLLVEASNGKITPEIIAAAKKAGELADRFGDLNALVGAFNPDAKFKALANVTQGVVGGFTAVQGAMGILGTKSAEVEQALLKVNSALALSQGINQVLEMGDSWNQLKAVVLSYFVSAEATKTVTFEQAAAAQLASAAAVEQAGAQQLAAATAAEQALAQQAVAATAVEQATAQQAVAVTDVEVAAASEAAALATAQLAAANVAVAGTTEAVAAANVAMSVATNASTVANVASASSLKVLRLALIATGIGAFIVIIGTLVANWDRLKKAIDTNSEGLNKIKAALSFIFPPLAAVGAAIDAVQQKFGSFSTFLKATAAGILGFFKGMGDIVAGFANNGFSGAVKAAKGLGDTISAEVEKAIKEGKIDDAMEAKIEALEKRNIKLKIEIQADEASGKDTFEKKKELLKNELVILQDTYRTEKELQEKASKEEIEAYYDKKTELFKLIQDHNKDKLDAEKAVQKKLNELREDALKSQAEIEKSIADKINANKSALDMKVSVTIQEEQALAELDDFRKQIEANNVVLGVQPEIGKLTSKQFSAISELRNQIQDAADAERLQIDIDAQIKLTGFSEDGLDKELKLLKLGRDAITKEMLKAGATDTQIVEYHQKQEQEIRDKYALEGISNREKYGIAIVEQSKRQGETEVQAESRKQIAIKEVMLKALNERLAIVAAKGDEASKVEAEQIKAEISNLTGEIDKLKKTEPVNIGELLGLDGTQVEKFSKITDSISEVTNAVGGLVSTYIDGQNKLLDEEQRINDERKSLIDERLSDVQQEFENELALAQKGYANNVSAKKAELDKLNAQKQAAIAKDKEIADKKAKLARVEAVANLVIAGSNVAVGVAKVLASSKDPITAIIAIIQAIAMVATFVAQLNALKANTGLGKGGLIQGAAHRSDGSGGVPVGNTGIMVEGNEYVTNKRTTAKYYNFIDELNKENITHKGMTDLKKILADNNIEINNDKVISVNTLYEQKQSQLHTAAFDYTYQKKAADLLNKMHEHETTKTEIIAQADGSIIERTKNNIKIIRNG